ncbi:diguanylate cyclase domain-containing protein [Azospirillum thermophilum]|nr:diguanylate cyclase [Azospirillum thermophilum]
MILQEQKLRDWVERLSAVEEFAAHPLMEEFRALAAEHGKLLRQVAKIAKISDRMQTDTRQMAQTLQAASQTDPLTGLPNRRHMIERLEAELARARRYGSGFALIMLDIDHFKAINDAWGHAVGDLALVETAALLRANLRASDLCARWGGEEFLILLSAADLDQARAVAEKLRVATAAHPTVHNGRDIRLTLSLGITVYHPGRSADDCIQAADDALYEAKRAGRDRWAVRG